ncbi:hypothetical protein GF354_00885 [Candidatus Peregrinibacteria bacterium]|nr:hypothetical protein [Candidatus Peregrinibacteria bacterium]
MEFLRFDNSENEERLAGIPENKRLGSLDDLVKVLAECLMVDAQEIKVAIEKLTKSRGKESILFDGDWKIFGVGTATDDQKSIILRRQSGGLLDIHLIGTPTRKFHRESGEMRSTVCFRAESVGNKDKYALPGHEIKKIWSQVSAALKE